MKIVCVSDLHGSLPRIEECDLLLVAGDVCPETYVNAQLNWLSTEFREWLCMVPAQQIVGIGGNHDFALESPLFPELFLPWKYLKDSEVTVQGLRIYGIPHVARLQGMAFAPGMALLTDYFDRVPVGVDIVLAHTPPMKHLDNVVQLYGAYQANSMLQRVRPKLYVCGHVHEGYGSMLYEKSDTRLVNASLNTILYEPTNAPIVLDCDFDADPPVIRVTAHAGQH